MNNVTKKSTAFEHDYNTIIIEYWDRIFTDPETSYENCRYDSNTMLDLWVEYFFARDETLPDLTDEWKYLKSCEVKDVLAEMDCHLNQSNLIKSEQKLNEFDCVFEQQLLHLSNLVFSELYRQGWLSNPDPYDVPMSEEESMRVLEETAMMEQMKRDRREWESKNGNL